MKRSITTLTLGLLLCTGYMFARPAATAVYATNQASSQQAWDDKQIADFLEKVLNGYGYVEDNIAQIRRSGHDKLASLVEELRTKIDSVNKNQLVPLILQLATKHGVRKVLLIKLSPIIKNVPDHQWRAALKRTRPITTQTPELQITVVTQITEQHATEQSYHEEGVYSIDINMGS